MELESLNKIELRECEEDMEKRRAIVKDVCQKFSLNQIPLNPREFYIAENNSLVWCNVFKAGSTRYYRKKFLTILILTILSPFLHLSAFLLWLTR